MSHLYNAGDGNHAGQTEGEAGEIEDAGRLGTHGSDTRLRAETEARSAYKLRLRAERHGTSIRRDRMTEQSGITATSDSQCYNAR